MDNSRPKQRPVGIGTGYASLMMIFVMLCLSILAALSLSAAESGKSFSRRSADYTAEYYSAQLEAANTLAAVDGIVSQYSDYSDFMLASELEQMGNVNYTVLPQALETSWLTPISDSQSILMTVRFSEGSFSIISCRTVSTEESGEVFLNVWQGE